MEAPSSPYIETTVNPRKGTAIWIVHIDGVEDYAGEVAGADHGVALTAAQAYTRDRCPDFTFEHRQLVVVVDVI